jgi:hypothetical protein
MPTREAVEPPAVELLPTAPGARDPTPVPTPAVPAPVPDPVPLPVPVRRTEPAPPLLPNMLEILSPRAMNTKTDARKAASYPMHWARVSNVRRRRNGV